MGCFPPCPLLSYGLATNIWLVLTGRILAGFAAANVAVAQAYIADVTNDVTRTAALGRLSSAITVGLLLGPALGGSLASVGGNRLLGFVAAGAALLGALWIALTLSAVPPRCEPETPTTHEATESAKKSRPGILSLFREAPALRFLFGLSVAGMLALAILEGTFGRLISHRLGYGPREFGWIFAFESLISVVVQYFLLTRLTARFTSRPLLIGAYLGQGIGLALTPFAPNLAALFGCSFVYALGVALANPTLNALSSRAAPENRQGEMFGLLQGARSVGFLAGPTLGGVLFDWKPESPYLLAGVTLLCAAIVVFTARRHFAEAT